MLTKVTVVKTVNIDSVYCRTVQHTDTNKDILAINQLNAQNLVL